MIKTGDLVRVKHGDGTKYVVGTILAHLYNECNTAIATWAVPIEALEKVLDVEEETQMGEGTQK